MATMGLGGGLNKRNMDLAVGAMDEESPMPRRGKKRESMGSEKEYSPDAAHKETFLEMCRAIREGDDDAAWAAYQECKELG